MIKFLKNAIGFLLLTVREVKLSYVLVPSPETKSLQSLLISVFKAPE